MTDNYSILTDGEMRGLMEAHASGVEVVSYMALTRYHNDPEHPARCWKSAQIASAETGISADVFRKALKSLTEKTFTHGGREVPILTKVSRGHNGRSAVYNDNLYEVCVLRDGGRVAGIVQPATVFNKTGSSRNDCSSNSEKPDEVAGMIRPSSRNDCSTQNKELLPVAAAAPPAQRSGGVRQPHKQESTSDTLQVVTGEDPARAPACAAQGRTAAALPTFAEVVGKGTRTGQDPLTPDEEGRYHQLLRMLEDHVAAGGDYSEALTPDEMEEYQRLTRRRSGSLRHE